MRKSLINAELVLIVRKINESTVWWSKWEKLIEGEEIELEKFEVNGDFFFFFLVNGSRKVIGNGKLKEK